MAWAVPLGLLGFALSLGPAGPDTGWRPFDLLRLVPGVLSFRAPGRMAVLVTFAVAMFVGFAVHATPPRFRRGLVVLLVAGFMAEGVMVHRPPRRGAAGDAGDLRPPRRGCAGVPWWCRCSRARRRGLPKPTTCSSPAAPGHHS
jgi:hypothetical protein